MIIEIEKDLGIAQSSSAYTSGYMYADRRQEGEEEEEEVGEEEEEEMGGEREESNSTGTTGQRFREQLKAQLLEHLTD